MPIEQPAYPGRRPSLQLGALIGSGDRIGVFVLPFALAGVALNIAFPEVFSAGGPPPWLLVVSAFVLAVGVVVWAWPVLLILTKVRAGEVVTTGPYLLVKHPLYTSVALLVMPCLGIVLNTITRPKAAPQGESGNGGQHDPGHLEEDTGGREFHGEGSACQGDGEQRHEAGGHCGDEGDAPCCPAGDDAEDPLEHPGFG